VGVIFILAVVPDPGMGVISTRDDPWQ